MTRLRSAPRRRLTRATTAGPYRLYRHQAQWLPVVQFARHPQDVAYVRTLAQRFGLAPSSIEVVHVDTLPADFETARVPPPPPPPPSPQEAARAAVLALDPARLPADALATVVRGLQAAWWP